MGDLGTYLDTLAAQAYPEGGWGYAPGQSLHLEPTCLALLALAQQPQRHPAILAAAWTALSSCTNGDGLYRLARGREEAVWPTALVLFLQAALARPEAEVQCTATALLSLRGRQFDPDKDLEVHDIDLNIIGWPWAVGNFSWVEPTAWACLALRRAGQEKHPRVAEGLRLLLDRAFDGGGINYGNRYILGRATEPIPGPTALMLLALQGHGQQPRVAAAVSYLLRQAGDDLEHLCWARIALAVHPDQPGVAETLPRLEDQIVAAQQQRCSTPWTQPSPLRTALLALALADPQASPFLLNGCPAKTPSDTVSTPWVQRRSLGERLRSRFRGWAVEAVGRLRQPTPGTAVHIAPATDYNGDLAGTLQRQYEAFRERVPLRGRRVVLKPNLVEYHRDKVINTHPHVVAAVIELCRREEAAEVIVAEGPGHCRNVEHLVAASGLGDVLRHYRVPFVDLNHDEPVRLLNLGRLTGLEYLYLSRTVATAEVLISLPKLKRIIGPEPRCR